MVAGGGPETGCPEAARPPSPCGWKRKGRATGSDHGSPPLLQSQDIFYPTVASIAGCVADHRSASLCEFDCGGSGPAVQNDVAEDLASETRTQCPRTAAEQSASGQGWAELE